MDNVDIKSKIKIQFDTFVDRFLIHNMLQSCVDIGLFEYLNLQKEPKLPEEIKEDLKLKITTRNFLDILDLLYVHKHLKREGVGIKAKYSSSHNFFVKETEGNFLIILEEIKGVIRFTKRLSPLLKEGSDSDAKDTFSSFESDPIEANLFYQMMGIHQEDRFNALVSNFDFSKYPTILDVGGCLGNLMIKIKQKYQNTNCTVFELPNLKSYFDNFQKSKNMENIIKFAPGDMFLDGYPNSDAVIMGNILHDWSLEKKTILLKKTFESLNVNGVLIVIEFLISEERNNVKELCRSYDMLLDCYGGYNVTGKELELLSKEVGFKTIEFLKDSTGAYAAIIYK